MRSSLCVLALAATLAAVALWRADAAYADEFLGFNEDATGGVHRVSPDQHAGVVRAIGGNTIRTNLDWRLAEPRQDVWSDHWWREWDVLYDAALERGVRPIFIIGFAPPWASEPGACGRTSGGLILAHEPTECEAPPARTMDVEWTEYATEVVRRFPKAAIEVWNEPNTDDYWRPAPDPKRYAELLTLARSAIKAVSPRTEVISGGLLNVRRTDPLKGEISIRDFLATAYSSLPTIKGQADYLGLHPYPSRASVGAGSRFRRSFEDVLAIRNAYGDTAPVLVTETGVSTADLIASPERRQANALERIHRYVSTLPDVAGVIYHRVIEPKDSSQNPREHGYAWLRFGDSPLKPRPVFCRFVAANGRSYPGC